MAPPNLVFADGDLLEYAASHRIAHQCNSTTKTAAGLAKAIFRRFPEADVYADGTVRVPGEIIVRGPVIGMVAQVTPGKPWKANDLAAHRKQHFQACLDAIARTFGDDLRIAFPFGIGCGMAGGDWTEYLGMISRFAEDNEGYEVVVVRLAA